ncbi:MAG: hypothetical protein IJL32_02495 [Oscillospiraceae bacterium]|nr:hypothetical protein [Oscillospiraceae bacterium]
MKSVQKIHIWLFIAISLMLLTGCIDYSTVPSSDDYSANTYVTTLEASTNNSEGDLTSVQGSNLTTDSTPNSKKHYKGYYVINSNTGVFHCTNCASVMMARAEALQYVESTCADLVEKGYSPCQKCHPTDIEITDNSNTQSVEVLLTPDEDADRILKGYNTKTQLERITEDDISYEYTGGGYHTTAYKNGIRFEICYADSFYLQAMAANESASNECFKNEVINFLSAIIGSSNAESVITEAVQTGHSVTYNKQTISFDGTYFRYSDDSWAS